VIFYEEANIFQSNIRKLQNDLEISEMVKKITDLLLFETLNGKFRIDTRTRYVRVTGSLVLRTHMSMFIINSVSLVFGFVVRAEPAGEFSEGICCE